MRKIYSFIFFVVLSGLFAHAAPLSPRNDQVCLRLDNNIQLIIDERIELVCTVFRLAGAQEYINYQLFDYISEVDDFVYNNKDHPIISFIKDIRDNYNFAYSIAAKSALMVKLSMVTLFTITRGTLKKHLAKNMNSVGQKIYFVNM